MESERPHLTRQTHQRIVHRRRLRTRHRRQVRRRRLRVLRNLRSAQFWSRAGTYFLVALCLTFWAKFAFVYDVPPAIRQGSLLNVRAYVVVKPWWFGPPVFDLGAYISTYNLTRTTVGPYALLTVRLGRYSDILNPSGIIWVRRQN